MKYHLLGGAWTLLAIVGHAANQPTQMAIGIICSQVHVVAFWLVRDLRK